MILARLRRHAGPALLAGLVTVAVYNSRQWRRDRALADRRRADGATVPELMAAPAVSALVAAWNEGAGIAAHIGSFLALRYPNIELIICAGGGDDTYERARRCAGDRVTVLEQRPGEGKQAALARCLERARGEVVYLTDADCRFDDEALVRLLAPLLNEGAEAATGGSRPLDEQLGKVLPVYIWVSDVIAQAAAPAYSQGLLGRNAAITRRALERSGGMTFTAPTGTDYQLARRLIAAGVRIRHVPDSVVPSTYPERLPVYRSKQSRWLRNLLLYGPGYGARGDVRASAGTVATGAVMLAVPAAAAVVGPAILVPWAILLIHGVSAKLRYALFAARLTGQPLPAAFFLWLVPLKLADFVIWASPLVDLASARRRHHW